MTGSTDHAGSDKVLWESVTSKPGPHAFEVEVGCACGTTLVATSGAQLIEFLIAHHDCEDPDQAG